MAAPAGSPAPHPRPAVRPGERGMTLVEMLVVLAIVGIAAGAVTLGMGAAGRGGGAESEARRLAARIRLAADEVMVTDTAIALTGDGHGYAFRVWNGRGWATGDAPVLARHDLPAGMALTGIGPAPVPIGVDGLGTAVDVRITGAADRWRVRYDGLSITTDRS